MLARAISQAAWKWPIWGLIVQYMGGGGLPGGGGGAFGPKGGQKSVTDKFSKNDPESVAMLKSLDFSHFQLPFNHFPPCWVHFAVCLIFPLHQLHPNIQS